MSLIPLPTLVQAARALAWTHYGAVVRLATLDGVTWTCTAIDPETYAHDESAPTGTAETPEGAVMLFVDGLHDVDTRCATLAADLATLAAEYPGGLVLDAPGDDSIAAERPLPHAIGDR